MEGILIFGWFIMACACGCLCVTIINAKAAGEATAWFFAGLILGPIGLLAAAGMPDKRLRELIVKTGGETAKVAREGDEAVKGLISQLGKRAGERS